MKIPVCKKLGKVTGFWNNYSALTILALVFSAFTVHAQLLDTVGKRTTQGGSGFIFIQPQEFLKGLIPPRDTLRLAIKDTGAIAYKNGAFYQWSKKSGVLRWDSLQAKGGAGGSGTDSAANPGAFTKKTIIGTVRVFDVDTARFRRVDTTYMLNDSIRRTVINGKNYDQLQKGSPFKQFYDPTQFDTTGGVLHCINCGAGGITVESTKPCIDSVLAYKPADGTLYATREFTIGTGADGAGIYKFVAASTATANGKTIFNPTAGGTGRWFLVVLNGIAPLPQLGIFPSSDNTTAINAALVLSSGNFNLGIPRNRTYAIDPLVSLQPTNNTGIVGEDSATSVLSAKTYSGHGGFMVLHNDTVSKLKNFRFDHIKFDYRQTWDGVYGFAGSNPIADTDSHIINITGGQNISITNCSIQNGGTNAGLILFSVDTAYIRNNRFTYLGNFALSTVYSQTNNNFWIENNYFDYFGMYIKYNAAAGKKQNGNDALELGGTKIHVRNNYFRNGADRLWFSMETKLWGYGNDVLSNTFDGNGRNWGGLSYANSEYNPLNMMYNPEIAYNKDVNMGYHVHKARDTVGGVELYLASNLMEHSGIDGLNSHDNYWQGMHYILSRRMLNSTFNDHFDNTGSVAGFESAENILFQLGTGGSDTVKNTNISGIYTGKDGELLRTYIGGEVIQGVNMNLNATWTGTHIIGELYSATGGIAPTGININNSIFNGSIGSAFYTQNTTPIIMNFTNNVAPALDTVSNFVTVISGLAPTINKENTRFSTGVFTTHVLKVNNTTPDAAGNVVVSSGFAPLGTIYNKNSWTSLADFTQAGGITASIVSNKIQVSGGAGTYTQLLELTPALGYTKLEHYKVAMKVKQGAINSTSYGYGIGVNSKNTFVNAGVVARIGFTTGSNPAGIELDANGGASYTAVSYTRRQISASANDYILVTAEKNGYDIHYTARNLTTNSALIDSTFAVGENTGPFSIFSMGGTFTIDSLAITSTELTGGSLFIGDSKTEGAGASDIDHRFLAYLQSKYDGVVGVGGGGDRTVEILGRIQQILSLRPRRAFLEIGSNDLRSGVSDATFKANFQAISDSLIAHGVDVYYLLPFYETSEDLSGQRAWIISIFPAAKVIDTWTPMAVPGRLAVDGIHPNDAGHQAIADAIVQANIIKEAKTELRVAAGTGGYTLPAATTSVLGGVKVDGTTVIMTGDVLSAPGGGGLQSTTTGAGNNVTSNLIAVSGLGNIPSSGSAVRMFFDGTYGNFDTWNATTSTYLDMATGSKFGFKIAPTAYVHIGAGAATAGNAPLKLTAGTILTSPEAGAIEFDGTHYYGTVGTTRYQLDQQSAGASPTFQQVLTAGATMTGNNTVALGGNNFAFSGTSTDPITISGNVNGESRFLETNANSAGGASHYWQNDRLSYSANYAGVYMGGSTAAGTFLGLPLADGFFLFTNGTNNAGLGIGTATSQPVMLSTNNTKRIEITGGGTIKLGTSSTSGYVWTASGTDGSGGWAPAGGGISGTYTSTLTNTTNISSSTFLQATYIQIGNIVTVTIGCGITPTSANTVTTLTMTLPVSTSTTSQPGVGHGSLGQNSGSATYEGGVVSINSGTTAIINMYPTQTSSGTLSLTFQYKTN